MPAFYDWISKSGSPEFLPHYIAFTVSLLKIVKVHAI
jgi:hypothetical protein